MKKRPKFSFIFLAIFVIITSFSQVSCKKGKGAICNDGTRSYSTGRGTCSWHGGVRRYIRPDEISVGKTIVLIGFLGAAGWIGIGVLNENNKNDKS